MIEGIEFGDGARPVALGQIQRLSGDQAMEADSFGQ